MLKCLGLFSNDYLCFCFVTISFPHHHFPAATAKAKTITTAFPTQVRQDVNSVLAQLVAWSLRIAAQGVAPQQGFYQEEFDRSTYRFAMRGQQLSCGWKPLSFTIARYSIFLHGWGVKACIRGTPMVNSFFCLKSPHSQGLLCCNESRSESSSLRSQPPKQLPVQAVSWMIVRQCV